MKEVDLGEPTSFLEHVHLSCTHRECAKIFWKITETCLNLGSPQEQQQSYPVQEELGSVGELSKVCSHIVLQCLHLSRIGRPDIVWSVNKLARAVTKWTRACDKRFARLISYILHTSLNSNIVCHVGNTAQQCRLGLFQDSDFAGHLAYSKSTSGEILCIFGSHTFVPTSWMCNKQTSVSHISTESEFVSLDAGVRTDGIPALDLWDLGIEVFHTSSNQFTKPKERVQGDLLRGTSPSKDQHPNQESNSAQRS